jgi:hypothetical protein
MIAIAFGIISILSGAGLIVYGSVNLFSWRSGYDKGAIACLVVGILVVIIGVLLCIAGAIKHNKNAKINAEMKAEQNNKKCPFCANSIRREAVVCQFCGKDLSNSTANFVPIATPVSGDTWVCKKCRESNRATSPTCKGCGAYR